jgi:hypothetical protein
MLYLDPFPKNVWLKIGPATGINTKTGSFIFQIGDCFVVADLKFG